MKACFLSDLYACDETCKDVCRIWKSMMSGIPDFLGEVQSAKIKALSIRQPWAWLIIHAGKDIENRTRRTQLRGRIYVHASKGMTRDEYAIGEVMAAEHGIRLPAFEELQRGGIIGSVEIIDCVEQHTSPWFFGPFGYVLQKPEPLPFTPCKGSLNFFTPDLPQP